MPEVHVTEVSPNVVETQVTEVSGVAEQIERTHDLVKELNPVQLVLPKAPESTARTATIITRAPALLLRK